MSEICFYETIRKHVKNLGIVEDCLQTKKSMCAAYLKSIIHKYSILLAASSNNNLFVMIFDHEIGKYFRFLCDLILCWLSQILIIVGIFFIWK